MLKSVRHQALKRAVRGDRSRLPPEHAARIVRILRELDIAITPRDMALPGYRLHALKGELERLLVSAGVGELANPVPHGGRRRVRR